MSDWTTFLHSERKDDGRVEYTGLIPAMVAWTLLIIVSFVCVTAVLLGIKMLIWAVLS